MSKPIDFARAPATETMLGVWFAPLQAPWNIHLFGLFYDSVRARFPKFETAPAVFPEPNAGPLLSFAPFVVPGARGLFIDEANTGLLQLQQTMFYANWRKMAPTDGYPRYHQQQAIFLEEWRGLTEFLHAHGVATPVVSFAQVSYVNHVALAPGETEGDVLSRIFASPMFPKLPEKTRLRGANATFAFDGKDPDTEILLQISPAVRAADNTSQVQFAFTVNHRKIGAHEDGLREALDIAHTGLIEMFIHTTSETVRREEWGQKD